MRRADEVRRVGIQSAIKMDETRNLTANGGHLGRTRLGARRREAGSWRADARVIAEGQLRGSRRDNRLALPSR